MAKPGADDTFVADIGGTHARFGRVTAGGELHDIRVLKSADYSAPGPAFLDYLRALGHDDPLAIANGARLSLAVAGAVASDYVQLTNAGWQFSCRDTSKALKLRQLTVVNDFCALAHALPLLQDRPGALERLHEGSKPSPTADQTSTAPRHARTVLGPGTGLGMAALIPDAIDRWIAVPSMGGHASFAARGPTQRQLLAEFESRQGRMSTERMLSGAGLERIYRSLAHGENPEFAARAATLDAAEIIHAAQHGDALAGRSANLFAEILGAVAGDAVLQYGAWGGAFLAGGMAQRLAPWVRRPGCIRAYLDKGRVTHLVQATDLWLIVEEHAGLFGAAAAAQQSASFDAEATEVT